MSLESFYYVSQIISAIAIIMSLQIGIVLGIEFGKVLYLSII